MLKPKVDSKSTLPLGRGATYWIMKLSAAPYVYNLWSWGEVEVKFIPFCDFF